MAPRRRTAKIPMRFSDKILDTIKETTKDRTTFLADIQALLKDLHYIADAIAEGDMVMDVQQWRKHVHWKQFYEFMDCRQQENPYPRYLFRAHLYGALIPRFEDEMTGELCDSFSSDLHHNYEEMGGCEVSVTVTTPEESMYDAEGLMEATDRHLRKTQVNTTRKQNKQEPYLSPMVSLSGDLRWTMHNTCQKGQQAHQDQLAGLAIFDTVKIQTSGVPIWRVKDLLDFFNNNQCFEGSRIEEYVRLWSRNADEYLCWEFVPKQALVKFVAFKDLIQQEDDPAHTFLQADFLSSTTLGHYRMTLHYLKCVTMDEYINKVSRLMVRVMDHIAIPTDAASFVDTMVENFATPSKWGYQISGQKTPQADIRSTVKIEYAWGISRWIDADRQCAPWYLSVCESIWEERMRIGEAIQ